MDLDVLCWGELHWYWFFNLFLPGFFLYVVGLPMITVAILNSKRHHLYGRWTKFRYGVLFTGYTQECYYWEAVIAARKACVIMISVFLTTAGAEVQALCAMMIVMIATVLHLLYRPFAIVTPTHNTLFWAEFWGLITGKYSKATLFRKM